MWRTRKILENRKVKPESPGPSVSLPLLKAAAEESRDELQELFARLLANSMDPDRRSIVRRAFTDAIQQMEPLDALILRSAYESSPDGNPYHRLVKPIFVELGIARPEWIVSLSHLERIDYIGILKGSSVTGIRQYRGEGYGDYDVIRLTDFGLELMRACEE